MIVINSALSEYSQSENYIDQDYLGKSNTPEDVYREIAIFKNSESSERNFLIQKSERHRQLFIFRGFMALYCRIFSSKCGRQSTLWDGSSPTSSPVRKVQTFEPTKLPTTHPSMAPSVNPTQTVYPSKAPTHYPSKMPSTEPTTMPSISPTSSPSTLPSIPPSALPSTLPSNIHSDSPSTIPTKTPTLQPTKKPSSKPSPAPTGIPTTVPSAMPSKMPISALDTCYFSSDIVEATCTNHISSTYKTLDWRILVEDQFLCSRNGRYRFGMTIDQSLCLCNENKKVWCADDCCKAGLDPYAIFEPSGNLAVYSDKRLGPRNMKLWESGTGEGGAKKLKLYNNGELSIVALDDTDTIIWEADTDAWVSS